MPIFHEIPDLLGDISKGRMVVLLDDENRENEGDLVLSADFINAEKINFLLKRAKGLICLAITEQCASRLNLPLMVLDSSLQDLSRPAFTLSIDAAHGIGSGVSAFDRARTIWVATRSYSKPSDIVSPGHIFPLIARTKGVFERPGHTEGSVDLMKLAGLTPAAVICEILNDDGSVARCHDLIKFCEIHNIKMSTVEKLIEYRKKQIGTLDQFICLEETDYKTGYIQ